MVEMVRESIVVAFGKDVLYQWIEELNQVAAVERRARGEEFSVRDHIRAMILALFCRYYHKIPRSSATGRFNRKTGR
ncbi:MAG TPA: hypothetical protein P5295_13730 [Spirochaetota bacterium]|nr:hypothetical protein [Spirochaetota bacterium]